MERDKNKPWDSTGAQLVSVPLSLLVIPDSQLSDTSAVMETTLSWQLIYVREAGRDLDRPYQ